MTTKMLLPSRIYAGKLFQQYNNTRYEHLIDLSETYLAILSRDEGRLSAFLSNGKALLDSQLESLNLYEMTVSVAWRKGCELLIDHGVKLASSGHELFYWIVGSGNMDVLHFWLNTLPSLEEDDLKKLGTLELALECVLTSSSRDVLTTNEHDRYTLFQEMANAVIAALGRQRRDLEILAAKHLCKADYNLEHDSLLDVQAWDVCKALEMQGVDVPSALEPSLRCIYYMSSLSDSFPGLEIYILDALYEAGFKDFYIKDHLGAKRTFVTPLLYYLIQSLYLDSFGRTLSVLGWFLAKGSDLDELWPESPSKGTHLLGWRLGANIYEEEQARLCSCYFSPGFYDWISIHTASSQAVLGEEKARYPPTQGFLDADVWQCIREALADKTPDWCNCHCSLSGCVPMTLLCKTAFGSRQDWWLYKYDIEGK
jgi:hypothetical protein